MNTIKQYFAPLFEKPKGNQPMPVLLSAVPDIRLNYNLWQKFVYRTARKITVDADLFVNRRVKQSNMETINAFLNAVNN